MAQYSVKFKSGFSESVRTVSLQGGTESEAIAVLKREGYSVDYIISMKRC